MNKPAETIEELQAQLVAVQDSVVHGKCANAEPCSTFCEAIATRKMMQQLRDENYILKSVNKGLAIGRNMAVEAAKNLGYKFDPKVSGLEYLIETASATVMVNQKNVELAAQIDNAWRELREIREALKADLEESTADEVRAMVSSCETLDSMMRSGEQRGVAKATEELSVMAADAFGDGYFEGFIDGGKRQDQEELNLKSDGGLARFSNYALRASEMAEGAKAERLGLSPRKQRQLYLPDFIMELSKQLNEQPTRCTSHQLRELQDWIKSLTAKAVSDENN